MVRVAAREGRLTIDTYRGSAVPRSPVATGSIGKISWSSPTWWTFHEPDVPELASGFAMAACIMDENDAISSNIFRVWRQLPEVYE